MVFSLLVGGLSNSKGGQYDRGANQDAIKVVDSIPGGVEHGGNTLASHGLDHDAGTKTKWFKGNTSLKATTMASDGPSKPGRIGGAVPTGNKPFI